MSRYVPTLHLRFIERQDPPGYGPARTVRVLQQGWAPEGGGYIEWRDVPLQPKCNCAAYCGQCMPAASPIPSQEG